MQPSLALAAAAPAPQCRPTDDARFDTDVRAAGLALVKFTGRWCPPCKAIQPTLDAIAAAHPSLTVLTLDVDEQQQVAQRYGVRSVPTLIAFRQGRPVGQLVGNLPREKIERLLGF